MKTELTEIQVKELEIELLKRAMAKLISIIKITRNENKIIRIICW